MRETSAEIEAIAAEWAVRADHAPLDAVERQTLNEWLADDIRRRGAFSRAQAMFVHARRTKALGPEFDASRYADLHAAERFEPESERGARPKTGLGRRAWLRGVAMAAAGAVVVVTVGIGLDDGAQAYTTQRGEMRLIPLADGSRMLLNTASKARVRFSKDERDVELSEGEASFDVAKDQSRPFVVVAGNTRIRAVGTSFTVRRLPGDTVQILVRSGTVEVQRPSPGAVSPVRANANSRVVISNDYKVETLTSDALRRELAWREGMLAFEDQSLAQAAREFARYSDRKIEFGDPTVANETITGLYATNDPQGFARSAALSLGLRAEPTDHGVILKR